MQKRSIFILSAVTLLSACQSTKPTIDTNENIDFSAFDQCQLNETVPLGQENPIVLSMVHQSIGQQAMQSGIVLTSADADCQINYQLTYKDKPNNSSVNFSFGTGRQTSNSSVGIGVGKTVDLPSGDTTITTINITLTYKDTPAWFAASNFENELDMKTSERKTRIDEAVKSMFDLYPSKPVAN